MKNFLKSLNGFIISLEICWYKPLEIIFVLEIILVSEIILVRMMFCSRQAPMVSLAKNKLILEGELFLSLQPPKFLP